MNYTQTLEFLYAQLPMYQRIGSAAYKKDLTNTLALCEVLGNPHHSFKTIHVAGTNGKGSCSHSLASVFQENGYKTGLYTSPHLIDFRERIKVDGQLVSEEFVVDFVAKIAPHIESIKPSFFEITVAMAFAYFADQKVDVAIIETGLGGRLDSTNVITPEVSLITNIGFDHTDMLGETLPEIAAEKAGIIKPNVPVVIGEHQPEVEHVFIEKARSVHASLIVASEVVNANGYTTDLKGIYQKKNMVSVLATVMVLRQNGWKLDSAKIKSGLQNVVKNTGLLGRWQTIQNYPKVVCDTGHNAEGIGYIVEQLASEKYGKLHIVFGQVVGKDPRKVLKLLPKNATYYFCQPSVIRALDVNELAEIAKSENLKGSLYPEVSEAHKAALEAANENDFIFVGGSTFVVADLLSYLGNIDSKM
ncbi:MAG: bifunctional folylpolyglutamate synthase/dihydrofolate synthase [Flavobacteriales bacterium]|nr:bifunctional folylpolyglutamate synthase/dihydrofolate synthase [Flavobacteriales bacterium]